MNTLRLKWRGSKVILVAACVCALFVVGGIAFAQTGNGVTIKWSSIDGGASTATGGVYALRGTIGQPEGSVTVQNGGVYSLQGGIIRLPAPIAIVPSGATASPGRNYFVTQNVTLRWTDVTYALGYWVEVARDNKFTQIVLSNNTLPESQLSYLASVLGNGTYYWHVRAKSKVSPLTWGPWSATDSFTVNIP
ncbi:MAG: hypothetical protein ABI690_21365 [Chloroflexota bacterium]